MMKSEADILEKILLPLDSKWEVESVKVDEKSEEVKVHLRYNRDSIEFGGKRYGIYDHRPPRSWRHLDLWQYKTYLVARVPRYKDEQGFYRSVEVPWAQAGEQISELLEKKR